MELLTRARFLASLLPLTLAAQDQGGRRIEEELFSNMNRARKSRGLPRLVWSEQLAGQARRHSENMSSHGFFSHNDPGLGNPATRLRRSGIAFSACAENIYRQSRVRGAARAALAAWMRSRGHRLNLMNPAYHDTGIGVATMSTGRVTITQLFVG